MSESNYYGAGKMPASEKFLVQKQMSFLIQYVTPSEFQIIYIIYMRTYFWGKRKELILNRHFLNGLRKAFAGPLPFQERALQKNIQTLLDKGAIERTLARNAYVYELISDISKWRSPPAGHEAWSVNNSSQQLSETTGGDVEFDGT